MATQFSFGPVGVFAAGQLVPMVHARRNTSEVISETAANQQTTATAPAGEHMACRVVATVPVYVSFGSNPNAVTDTGTRFYMPAGAIEYFGVQEGWKGAVVIA